MARGRLDPPVAKADRSRVRRQVHRLRHRVGDADAEGLRAGADEVHEARRAGQPVEHVRRADRRELVRARHVRGVDQDRPADVHDRRPDRDPLVVDRDPLGTGEPQLLDNGQDVRPGHEVVALAVAGRNDRGGVRELDDETRAGHRRQPGGDPRRLQLGVERLRDRRAALAGGLQVLDRRPEGEDLLLEAVLLLLEVQHRLHERRPLLAGVPDARPLGRELGGDQEAQREQRQAERHLPAGDRPDAGRQRRHAAALLLQAAGHQGEGRAAHGDDRGQQDDRAPATIGAALRRGRRRARRVGWAGRRSRPASRPVPGSRRVASQPPGSGPGGAGCGPYGSGISAPSSASQPAWNAARSMPTRLARTPRRR